MIHYSYMQETLYAKPHLPIKYIFFSLFGMYAYVEEWERWFARDCVYHNMGNAVFCFIFEDMTLQRLGFELGVVGAWWYICAYPA